MKLHFINFVRFVAMLLLATILFKNSTQRRKDAKVQRRFLGVTKSNLGGAKSAKKQRFNCAQSAQLIAVDHAAIAV